jgi:hypothetical protein
MIDNFDDFCLYMYVIVDDLMQEIAGRFKRRGPVPTCSDSEMLTMVLVGECRGWDLETDLLSYWGEHRDLFPCLPDQSRFNRRRRNLLPVLQVLRQRVVQHLEVSHDGQCAIDSLPVPVVQFHHAPRANRDWLMHDATFGRVSSKQLVIFGYKLHLLVTLSGVIVDFALAPAHATDLSVAVELLDPYTDLTVYGDKAYISAPVAADLQRTHRLRLLTIPRANQQRTLPDIVRKTFSAVRQIIETVNGQLAEQFHLERNHAYTFRGLCARLLAKLTAHTLCIFINRLLGQPDFLHIKHLAFPT